MSFNIPVFPGSNGTTLLTQSTWNLPNAYALEKEALQLKDQIQVLKGKLATTTEEYISEQINSTIHENKYLQLKEKYDELSTNINLQQLITQIHPSAASIPFNKNKLIAQFNSPSDIPSYILSIDLRRSTELMLKAKSPRRFGEFIYAICNKLKEIIISNFGVFDKFTGDGVLAFFPEFYSGKDAGSLALRTAFQAHDFFTSHYKANRSYFSSVLCDVGLGIGIDYGRVNIVQINSYTVVGTPVVYACRLSGASPGDTLLNQQAYEDLTQNKSQGFKYIETTHKTKNEELVAYKAIQNGGELKCEPPDWAPQGCGVEPMEITLFTNSTLSNSLASSLQSDSNAAPEKQGGN